MTKTRTGIPTIDDAHLSLLQSCGLVHDAITLNQEFTATQMELGNLADALDEHVRAEDEHLYRLSAQEAVVHRHAHRKLVDLADHIPTPLDDDFAPYILGLTARIKEHLSGEPTSLLATRLRQHQILTLDLQLVGA